MYSPYITYTNQIQVQVLSKAVLHIVLFPELQQVNAPNFYNYMCIPDALPLEDIGWLNLLYKVFLVYVYSIFKNFCSYYLNIVLFSLSFKSEILLHALLFLSHTIFMELYLAT